MTAQPFPDWVPTEARRAGAKLSIDEALAMLPSACAR